MAGGVNYATHVHEAPITKRKRYIGFTPDQFLEIAKLEYDQVRVLTMPTAYIQDSAKCKLVLELCHSRRLQLDVNLSMLPPLHGFFGRHENGFIMECE